MSGIKCGDENKEGIATQHLLKILCCRGRKPAIDTVINANVVPKLVEFLSRVSK
jgi:importin subunit alpha-2